MNHDDGKLFLQKHSVVSSLREQRLMIKIWRKKKERTRIQIEEAFTENYV